MYSNNSTSVTKAEIYHLIGMNRIDTALQKIDGSLSFEPNDAENLFLKAACLLQKERLTEAMELCTQAMNNGFASDRCHYLMGRISFKSKDYVDAEEHYLESLSIKPGDSDVLAYYGELMYWTGHEKKAFQLIEEAIRIDPYNSDALNFLLKYSLAGNNKALHTDVLQRCMQSSDSELAKLIKIGLSQLMFKNYRQARESFRQAYLMNPADSDLLSLMKDMDIGTHPYFFLINKAEKIGGPKVIWVSFILIAIALRALKQDTAFTIILITYLVYAVYTWTTVPFRKYLEKRISRA